MNDRFATHASRTSSTVLATQTRHQLGAITAIVIVEKEPNRTTRRDQRPRLPSSRRHPRQPTTVRTKANLIRGRLRPSTLNPLPLHQIILAKSLLDLSSPKMVLPFQRAPQICQNSHYLPARATGCLISAGSGQLPSCQALSRWWSRSNARKVS